MAAASRLRKRWPGTRTQKPRAFMTGATTISAWAKWRGLGFESRIVWVRHGFIRQFAKTEQIAKQMTDLGTDERRVAIEAIATLCHIKRAMVDLLLKPA